MAESDPERRVSEMLREIEQQIEAGVDVTGRLPDLLLTLRHSLELSQIAREELWERYERLLAHQIILDERLLRLETSRPFRYWNLISLKAVEWYGRLKSPFHHLLPDRQTFRRDYVKWVNHEEAGLPSVVDQRSIAGRWRRRPQISIILPVFRSEDRWLAQAVASVRAQSYENWELCIAADAPQDGPVMRLIEENAACDPRIRFVASPQKEGISAALNAASEIANGEYLGFLEEDAVLSPFALHYVVESIQDADWDLIYSDEDRLGPGSLRTQPIFKPDWSPRLLLSCMYIGHFLIVRREAFDRVHRFRRQFDGAQDHDLALRVAAEYGNVRHISRVLYHGRNHESSKAVFASKPWSGAAGRRAVEEATATSGRARAEVTAGAIPCTYEVRWPVPQSSTVSIIICSKSLRLIERCVKSVRNTVRGVSCEVLVVHHEDSGPDPEMRRVLARLGTKVLPYRGTFHFALMNNAAAAETRTPYLLFINDDVYAESDGWCERMLGEIQQREVGIAGALLRYPNGAIQHAGLVLGIGDGAGHVGRFQRASELWPWLTLARDVSAVTGACMAIRADVFRQLGGFDPSFPNNYNDVDLCLRASCAGYRIVCVATERLFHSECATRRGGAHLPEREAFYSRWMEILRQPDPYYSPCLRATEKIALNGYDASAASPFPFFSPVPEGFARSASNDFQRPEVGPRPGGLRRR